MPPEVTVLTAVRNGAQFLPETIASIRAQSFDDWEHIVVDDASDDASAAIVEREAHADARIRLIRREKSGGPYIAANDGLRVAEGRYVARIDADDIATPRRLELQLQYMSEHAELRACGGFHRTTNAAGEPSPSVVRVPVLGGVLRWRLCIGSVPVHSSAFIERAALEEMGEYRPLPVAQDWWLWCELSRRGWLGIVPEVVVHRRLHDGQISVQRGPMQMEFANDVIREHIHELAGEEWSHDDVELLRRAANGLPVPLAAGLRSIDRWAELWKTDAALSEAERAELHARTRAVRRYFVRRWGEALPAIGRGVRAAYAANAGARRAVVRALQALRLRERDAEPDSYVASAQRLGSGSGSSP